MRRRIRFSRLKCTDRFVRESYEDRCNSVGNSDRGSIFQITNSNNEYELTRRIYRIQWSILKIEIGATVTCFQLRPTLSFDSSVRLYVLDRFYRNTITLNPCTVLWHMCQKDAISIRMRKIDNNFPFLLTKKLKLSTYYISLCNEDGFTSRHDNTYGKRDTTFA